MHFLHLDLFFWAWTIVVAGVLVAVGMSARTRAWRKLATADMRGRLMSSTGIMRHGLRGCMLVAALALMVVALLDPRWGIRYEPVAQRNIDVMFVLDTSRSMLADDLPPSRLARARQYIDDVLEIAAGDRMGLVTFAGQASLEVPLTRDATALRLSLERVGPRTGGAGGSLIGDAIRLAADSFTGDSDGSKAIIVLSDGDDMDSWPVEAAAAAKESGARVWTVGLGDADTGARIPIEIDGERLFLTHEGEEVWVQMQSELLEQIAIAGDGAFIPAGTSDLDLGDVYEQVIAPGSGRRTSTAMVEQLIPRYVWFITPALMLLILEWLMGRCSGARPEQSSRPKTLEEVPA